MANSDFRKIKPLDFLQITADVFNNLDSCTYTQKRILLETAQRSDVYGYPSAWTASVTRTLGLILTVMDESELHLIRPEAMAGVAPETIVAMFKRNLHFLLREQVAGLDPEAVLHYRRLVGMSRGPRVAAVGLVKMICFIFYLHSTCMYL